MDIKTFTIILKTDKKVSESAEMLRGFFGRRFSEFPLLHQHVESGLIYSYPLVQYKVVEGTPIIIGLSDGVDAVKSVYDKFDNLELGKSSYKVVERKVSEKEAAFGLCDEQKRYRFVTPWLALNEKNYESFQKSSTRERTLLLNKVLVGNILSISKSLEYVVLDEIKARTKVEPVKVMSKGVPMVGFTGEFSVNFIIPSLLGLGKSVSRGFGTVKALE